MRFHRWETVQGQKRGAVKGNNFLWQKGRDNDIFIVRKD
jgi:hypothetical protein